MLKDFNLLFHCYLLIIETSVMPSILKKGGLTHDFCLTDTYLELDVGF